MQMFNIKVITKKPKKIRGLNSYEGEITIGDFQDRFIMPITNWCLDDYKNQWKEGLERIKIHDASCLVVTAQNMDTYPIIFMWTLYKVEDKVFFHEQLLNAEIALRINPSIPISNFNSTTCYEFILPRCIDQNGQGVDRYGEKIFETSIPLSKI
jgi:hypothetical protein